MPHFIKLHLTTLDERSKAGRKRERATGSEHLLVGMKIAIPVLPSVGSYIIDDARSCLNDDCFHLPAFRKTNLILDIPHLLLLKGLHYKKNDNMKK